MSRSSDRRAGPVGLLAALALSACGPAESPPTAPIADAAAADAGATAEADAPAGLATGHFGPALEAVEISLAFRPEPVSERAGYYGYGRAPTAAEIAGWDIDVRPDGTGLPEGSGSVTDGEMLRPEQGYPVRLLNPGWEGNTSVKWLRRLEVGDQPWHHREETSKYTDLMPDGSARQFTYVQETNSVITFPCPEKPVREKGRYELEGLAWSGRGRIRRVDVSLDGGITWREARLKGLILPKALTRFSLDFDWDGGPALLQSRAMDETGYVQPTLSQLRDVRGTESIYHKNAIHTWRLAQSGEVTNVQIE
jgi:hypothetical protein